MFYRFIHSYLIYSLQLTMMENTLNVTLFDV